MTNYNWSNYGEHDYFDICNENFIINKLKQFFERNNIKYKNKKIIEFGSGHGIYTILFSKIFKEILAIEPEYNLINKLNYMIKINKLNIITINKSVEKFNSDSKFDFIICMNSFLFFKNTSNTLIKFSKIIKKNGYLIIMQPINFLNFDNKNFEITNKSIFSILKSKKFKIFFHGTIINGLHCFILKLK